MTSTPPSGFLDNIIDINWFPFEKLREVNQGTRRIGLGIMGWADLLAELGIPYDSDDALGLAHEMGRILKREAHLASKYLAEEKGELRPGYGYRNSATTTIAPTGSISIIAGCSSGIEPHYALFNSRKALWTTDGKSHEIEVMEMPAVIRKALGNKLPPDSMTRTDPKIQREYVVHHGGEEYLDICRTAMEIAPEAHVLHAGGLAGIHRQRCVQDREPPLERHRRGCGVRLQAGLPRRLQGLQHLPGREQGNAGAQLRRPVLPHRGV